MKLVVGIVVLAILAAILFRRHRRRPVAEKRPRPAVPAVSDSTSTYHAVSIKFASSACAAAKDLEGKRFLSSAAPKIPLPGCDAAECKCRFVHHADRRDGEDRRHPFGSSLSDTAIRRKEQRSGRDRRENSD